MEEIGLITIAPPQKILGTSYRQSTQNAHIASRDCWQGLCLATNRWPSSSAPKSFALVSVHFWAEGILKSIVLCWSWSERNGDKGEYGGGTEKGRKEGTRQPGVRIMALLAPCMPPTHSVAAHAMQGDTREVYDLAWEKPVRGCSDGLLRKTIMLAWNGMSGGNFSIPEF